MKRVEVALFRKWWSILRLFREAFSTAESRAYIVSNYELGGCGTNQSWPILLHFRELAWKDRKNPSEASVTISGLWIEIRSRDRPNDRALLTTQPRREAYTGYKYLLGQWLNIIQNENGSASLVQWHLAQATLMNYQRRWRMDNWYRTLCFMTCPYGTETYNQS
jgi:hypothetical protein